MFSRLHSLHINVYYVNRNLLYEMTRICEDLKELSINDCYQDLPELIKAIVNNCPKIKRLSTYLEPKDFIHVKILLLNCKYLEDV